jgi:hypothetical protein
MFCAKHPRIGEPYNMVFSKIMQGEKGAQKDK